MGAFGIGRIITRFVIIFLSGWLTSLLSKILSEEETAIGEKIDKYSRTNLKLTIRARKLLRIIRVSLPIIIYSIVIVVCGVGIIVIWEDTPDDWAESAIVSLVTVIFVLIINMVSSINKGNISTLVVKNILSRNEPFTLYLRAFKSDRDSSNFSEKHFVRLLERMSIPELYAVGLPNEMDAPYGATRVYISDSTWEQEVEELMIKASEIYLRVCDTEPCKWELGKSLLLRGKLILLVDNISEYDTVRGLYPELPELEAFDGGFYCMRYEDAKNEWIIQKYKLSPKGYVDVTDNESQYERILELSKQERKEIEQQKINPDPLFIGMIAILLILGGIAWYWERSHDIRRDRRYSMVFSYDRTNHYFQFGEHPIDEEFNSNSDNDAYEYAEKKFSSLVNSLYTQYNGNLAHDDSLDRITPLGFYVYGPSGIIHKPNHDPIREYSELIKLESVHGAKWRMGIDSVQHISFFSKWERNEIELKVNDSVDTISLLCGRDTLANHLFDEYLFFAGSQSNKKLAGALLVSLNNKRRNENIQRVYSDVKYQLRKRYGVYNEYWDCKVKNVTCDTISYHGYSGVVLKTEFTRGPHKPRFINLPQAVVEQLY